MPNSGFDAAQYNEVPYDSEPTPRPSTQSVAEPQPEPQPQGDDPLPQALPARLDLDGEWKRVSPRYVVIEVVTTIIWGLIICVGAALLWLLADQTWALWVGLAILLIFVVSLIFEPRRVRSIGYQLRADDLLFRRGILFQRFVAVPYGRMQLVDITRGPVARWLGLADLKFVTAAATTAVSIPGLKEDDAEALRDRLVELAESRRAGL